jgi:hypothetical protein
MTSLPAIPVASENIIVDLSRMITGPRLVAPLDGGIAELSFGLEV